MTIRNLSTFMTKIENNEILSRNNERTTTGGGKRSGERTRKEGEISQQFAVKKKDDRQHFF